MNVRSNSTALQKSAVWAACIGLAAGCCSPSRADPPSGYRGYPLADPREKVDFVLADTEGEAFDFREQTDGYVTLLFFGYTHCPDVCPVQMANIGAVLERSSPQLRRRVKVVFVTTDPERDTPQRLRTWLDAFHPSFIGLRGDTDKVNEIQIALGLPPAVKGEMEEDGDYEVGHSAYVLAFGTDNRAHLLYPFGTRQADWAHDLPKLVKESWEER